MAISVRIQIPLSQDNPPLQSLTNRNENLTFFNMIQTSAKVWLAIIALGAPYLVAFCGINRVEKHVKQFRANIKAAIDEQQIKVSQYLSEYPIDAPPGNPQNRLMIVYGPVHAKQPGLDGRVFARRLIETNNRRTEAVRRPVQSIRIASGCNPC